MQVLLAYLWSEHMESLPFELPLFLLATFAGAVVAGLSGFAFGLVAASLWLYILTPLQSTTLIVAFGLIVQGYSVSNASGW
jgi:thiamine transporter ThiT